MSKIIPETEFSYQFTGSSGPGGQNVNKTSTKVRLFWWPEESLVLSAAEQGLIGERLAKHKVDSGAIVIEESSTRSQSQNRSRAIERLQGLVSAALRPRVIRKRTKATRASKERRLQAKKHRGQTKQRRRSAIDT